nr:unnamed protein product [Callosobruchus chinensis]
MDSKDFQVAEITEECSVKSESESSMNATPDIASTSIQKSYLANHMLTHFKTFSTYKLSTCAHCQATFKSTRGLDDHVVKNHPNFITSVARKIHECSKCGYKTILKFDYDKHNATLHPETPSPHKRRECLHCDSSFTSRMALDNHVVKKHPDFITSVTSKLYECTECHYKTTMKHDFNRHTSMHQGTTPSYSVTCAHCNVKLKSKRALDDHVIRKHPDFVTSVSRKIHECSMCSYKTLHKSSFDKHMTTHTETTLRECIHCNATFKSRASLDDHTLRKHPDFIATITRKIYECINCIYKTTIKSHFNKHMSVHTENARGGICVQCNATFKSARALDDHVVKKHPNDTASVSRKIHECTKCSYKTIFRYDLDRHDASSHPEAVSCIHCNLILKTKAALDEHVVKKHPDSIASLARRIYECLQCFYKTTIKRNFDRHLSTHSEDVSSCELIQCDHCTAKFKSKLSLDDHVIRKHPEFIASVSRKIHECPICFYKTVNSTSFNRHTSRHSKIASSYEPKACVHCNATFKRKLWLDDHVVRKHVDFMSSVTSKLHECTKCSYKTVRKKLLVRHFLTHSYTAKSYSESCVHCNAKYQQRISLDDHIIKKHPEFITSVTRNVYKCTKCTFKTAKKGHFDRHTLMHSGIPSSHHVVRKHPSFIESVTSKIYECEHCVFKTIKKHDFDKHLSTHSSYKFSSCHHCGAKFKIKADLDEHLVENHPNFIVSLSRKVYECTYCVYKTTVKKSLDKHMSSHPEADPSDKPNTCMYCNVTLCNKRVRDDHVVKKHPHLAASVNRKIFECAECSYRTISKIALNYHVVKKHPSFITSVTKRTYECAKCLYKTIFKHLFDRHMLMHPERSNFSTCIHCNATFNTDKWLDAHIVKTHPGFAGSLTRKIYECTLCPYKTVFKYKLDRHMLKHAETDKINACIHCNATFKNKADLDEHVVRRHPNFTSSLSRKIYECTQCVYKSLRKKSFVKHMSRHPEAVPGDSLNRCVHCNATLRSKRALDDHVVRKHPDSAAPVGRKILECTECRFKTVLKGSLAQHMLTHFKAYNL